MGTAMVSRWVKALSGTWPPVGNTAADAMGPPPNAVVDCAVLEALAAVLAAELVLPGPSMADEVEPPATRPAAAALEPAPVRMNRLLISDRKSTRLNSSHLGI